MPELSTPPANLSPTATLPTGRRSKLGAILPIIAGILLVLFIAVQFVPVNRTDPPITTQLAWDSSQTKTLAYQACMDCHSNETRWPWYSHIAPASWLIYYDVTRGRHEFNLSTYSATEAAPQGNLSDQPTDLAYKLGQGLAGGGQGHPDGMPPGGQFPTPDPGQAQGQFPGGGPGSNLGDRLAEHIQMDEMPPAKYLLLHPVARLTKIERQELLQGLLKTLGLSAQ